MKYNKILIAMLFVSTGAMAADNNNINLTTTNSNSNATTNSNSTSTSTATTNATSNATTNATSNSVIRSTSDDTNTNISDSISKITTNATNLNTTNTVSNDTNTNITTANNTNINASTSTSTVNNVQSGTATNNTNAVSTSNENTTSRSESGVSADYTFNTPPPSAFAPQITNFTQDTCTTGASMAVQTQVFGLSGGKEFVDENCELLKLSAAFSKIGRQDVAISVLCQDERVFAAMKAAGTPCMFEGKSGEEALAGWEANPDQVPGAKKSRFGRKR